MKYKVFVSELRYGSVEVEAETAEEAEDMAYKREIHYYDSEITDLWAEPMEVR